MKKRGFTLIELLAVIIVLSIIALIATPMILGTIEDSKRSSFEQGMKNIAKAARTYQAREEIDNPIIECRYFSFDNDVNEVMVRDEKTYYPMETLLLKGKLPAQGEIKICSDEITIEASDGLYSGKYDDGQTNIVKGDLADNDLATPIIDIFNVTATTDKIVIAVSAYSPSDGGAIVNYYYKINGGNYIKTTEPSYIFENLNSGENYIISVKVENKSGITNEKSKTITTKKFGELTIEVADIGNWTSSKTVTIKSSNENSNVEYNVIKYNEKTSQDEETGYAKYTESFILDTLATQEHPTIVTARYNNNGVYSDEKTYVITKIDPSQPTNTSPSVVVSTTKPTSEANVVLRQADDESGLNKDTIQYGYSTSEDGTYIWQSDSLLTKLGAGNTYYVKTRVTNNAGLTSESEAQSYQVGAISTCSVNILTSGWATNKDVRIIGSQTGAELQYQIGTTDADKWKNIENNEILNIKENTTVYCRLWDGITENVGQGVINQIDTTPPTNDYPTVTQSPTDSKSLIITNNQVDNESGLNQTTLSYGYSVSEDGEYTWQSSNTFGSLVAGTTYYFKTKITNNLGMETVSNPITGRIEYTGIAAGTYSAGQEVTYAGTDWQVIKDNGNNVTLISKNNIGTGSYSGRNVSNPEEYSVSTAKIKIDEWFNSNSTLLSDKNVQALVADSTTGYYARLPRSNELSTNIPNGSGTAFWTMTIFNYDIYDIATGEVRDTAVKMIVAASNGSADYKNNVASEYGGQFYSNTGIDGRVSQYSTAYGYSRISEVDYLLQSPSVLTTLGVSAFQYAQVDGYYSSITSAPNEYGRYEICHNVKGVTAIPLSANTRYAVGNSTCKQYGGFYMYKGETILSSTIGYRPVITVKEK